MGGENRLAVIAVYGEDGRYKGIITYQDLIKHSDMEAYLNTHIIVLSDNFWVEAQEIFKKFPDLLLPVFDTDNHMRGFAYNDANDYSVIESYLVSMENGGIPAFSEGMYSGIRMILITDINELAWRCYRIFKKWGYEICVIGDRWEWFGLVSGAGYENCPDYAKFYVYAEGTEMVREEKEYGKSRYKDVREAFEWVNCIMLSCMKIVYESELNKLLNKGIRVCECRFPRISRIKKKTELEKQSMQSGFSLDICEMDSGFYTEEMKKCIMHIYGEQSVKAVLNNDRGVKGKIIPVGNFSGQVMREEPCENTIYLIGPCVADGYGCLAEDSLAGQIQKRVLRHQYKVVSISIEAHRYDRWYGNLEKIPVRENDIILMVNDEWWFPNGKRKCARLEFADIYDRENRNTYFCSIPIHTNQEGNRVIAEEIYKGYLKNSIKRSGEKKNAGFLQKGELLNDGAIAEIREFTDKIRVNHSGIAGAVVMNCNPFTCGHRHLIEYALKKVDFLYVFVVEENRSLFTFSDRFDMVRRGIGHSENVAVVPSGRWVLSYSTMPAYFHKECRQDIVLDAGMDLEIFARYIAAFLRIQKRFIGEEPFDKITEQYNRQMHKVLGDFGVQVEEIPRMQCGGREISASYVRRCMESGRWEHIKSCLPETSYDVCLGYRKKSD